VAGVGDTPQAYNMNNPVCNAGSDNGRMGKQGKQGKPCKPVCFAFSPSGGGRGRKIGKIGKTV